MQTDNKSAAVREYLDKHPNAMPVEIVAALADQGIEVKPSWASAIRSSYRQRKKVADKIDVLVPDLRASDLLAAKQFVEAVGGEIGRAREALEALDRLVK